MFEDWIDRITGSLELWGDEHNQPWAVQLSKYVWHFFIKT